MADARNFIRLHDGIDEHPKIEALSDKAFRHLITLWCYCSRNLTDGVISDQTWRRITTTKTARELVAAGLADNETDGYPPVTDQRYQSVTKLQGHHMHDYLEHQRSRAEVEDLREKRRSAGQKGGQSRANQQANAQANAKANAQADGKPISSRERRERELPSSPPRDTAPPAAASGGTRGTTPTRQLAATLLRTDPTDPRLDHLPDILRGVRAPGPWLRATAEAGDLEPLLAAATEAGRDPWANVQQLTPEHPYVGSEPLPEPTPMPADLRARIRPTTPSLPTERTTP